MCPSDPEPPAPAEGERPPAPPAEGHISFVERLQRRFGPDVDPKITLAGAEGEEEEPAPPAARGEASSTSRGLLRKLSLQEPIAARYEVKREIARGGMGTILRVWDEDLRRHLAMKVLHGPGRVEDESSTSEVGEERLGRFLEEAQITGQLDHPGVVPVHDLGIDREGRCFFTMRLVRGRELREVFDLARAGKEGWTITRALSVVLKVCEAMAFAHSKGVIHRDLKPSNVMVGRFGETYVMDWGLARVLGRTDPVGERVRSADGGSNLSLVRTVRHDESEANPDSPLVTMDGDVVGTPAYMSIEQAQGKLAELGPRSDVYSLGTILYYLLTGRSPYVEPGERVSPHTVLNRVLAAPPVPASRLARNMPGELVAICEKAMARRAEDRYGNMLEVVDDLQAYLENRVVRAYERGSVAEFRKWVARNRGFAAALAGMVTLALASAIAFAVQKTRQADELQREQRQTKLALDEAEHNAKLARAQRELADRRSAEADHNAQIASENEEAARLSGYKANLLAADFSFRSGDVLEGRHRLGECTEDLRGWEWDHLALQGEAALLTRKVGTQTAVDAVEFTVGGDRALVLRRTGRVLSLDLATGETVPEEGLSLPLVADLRGPLPGVMDVLADDSGVALAGKDGVVRLFERPGGGVISLPADTETMGHGGSRVGAVAFSPDRRHLASGAEDGEILVWGALSHELEQRLSAHRRAITALAWAPESERLASSSTDGTVRLWDTGTGTVLHVLKGHTGTVHDVAWDAQRDHVVSGGEDGLVELWDAADGTLLQSFTGHGDDVLAVGVDPRSGRIASGSLDRTVRVWDPEARTSTLLLGHEASVLTVAFSPAGDLVLSGSEDGYVKLWDARGDLSSTMLDAPGSPVQAVAFRPDGRLAATSAADGAILLWDAEAGLPVRRLVGHAGLVTGLAFSADGRLLVSASLDKTARLWHVDSGRLERVFAGHTKWLETAVLSPDASLVVTGSGDKSVRVWSAVTGELQREITGHRYSVPGVAVSPDGRLLATGGQEIFLRAFDQDEPLAVLPGHRRRVRALEFDPTGERIVSAADDGSTRIWDVASRALLRELRDHDGQVQAVVHSPDGSRLVTASDDRLIRVREARTGDTLLILRGHTEPVLALAFDGTGRRLLSGSADGTARIWETGGREERRRRHLEEVQRREGVGPVVERLFTTHHVLETVLAEIERSPEIAPAARDAACTVARLRAPALMSELSEAVVSAPGATAAAYDAARRQAEAAASLDPQNPHRKLVSGMAHYRAGNLAATKEALRALAERDEATLGARLDPERDPAGEATRLLYLAMAYQRTGEAEEAHRSLEGARRMLADLRGAPEEPRLLALLAEAESIVPAPPPDPGSTVPEQAVHD
ncbi:MAG: protein kinase [Planctomycetota bacterium]